MNSIKEQIAALPKPLKVQLAAFLTEQLQQPETSSAVNGGKDEAGKESLRLKRMQWLKTHREEYGGQYVALDGVSLVAVGRDYREAREKALAAGRPNAFVTYLSKPDEVAEWGGW